MRNIIRFTAVAAFWLATGCTSHEEVIEPTDFAFDGTCVNCHAGLSAGHVHTNYKLRCIDCHGGDDTVVVDPAKVDLAGTGLGVGGFRDATLVKAAHVNPDPKLARFFYANGVDDDGDGQIDEPTDFVGGANPAITSFGEIFEPGLHGEGAGEFMDVELNRDLNYTRFLNPGDLRIATVGCGSGNRQAGEQGFGCHQETIDIVRRSIMTNQAAVTNGAYYQEQSPSWIMQRDGGSNGNMPAADPRFGAASYALDYDAGKQGVLGAKPSDTDLAAACIKPPPDKNKIHGKDSQPFFDRACLQQRASSEDSAVAAGAPGNAGLPAFEIAQGTIKNPLFGQKVTQQQNGAGDSRWEGWGGNPIISDAHAELAPLENKQLLPPIAGLVDDGVPDPVDNILRTFRAYYPLNYPASTNNFNFTFGTSIQPDFARFRTANPYGRGHSSGCAACHAPYNYEGTREPTRVRNDDGTFTDVVDPTTKHREFDPTHDRGQVFVDTNNDGIGDTLQDRLIGRPVSAFEVVNSGGVAQGASNFDNNNATGSQTGGKDGEQQRTFSAKHNMTTKVDTDTCGLCHAFVTRINYAYQGAAEEEQRDVLSRRKPIEFETPKGTKVVILDSWVREENRDDNNNVNDPPKIIEPAGVDVVKAAKERDKKLREFGCDTDGDGKPDLEFPACGLIAGAGGCAQSTFTEDCNNNGELDHQLTLQRFDEDGNLLFETTIDEDFNAAQCPRCTAGKLDLIDRVPREKSNDGRQNRYVYGGRNNSTRQMDVHFELGMHCIDCHFLQDVHGDGNVYSTNWDAIEIECEDCHGASQKTNFKTSGPNGGTDLRIAKNENLEPFFEEKDGKVIQRSRVNTGLFWEVKQTKDAAIGNTYAQQAHDPTYHVAEPGQGSEFVGEQGQSELTRAKVECATCHNGWVHNCVGCHIDIDVGNKQRNKINGVEPNLTLEKSAGENEIWLANTHNTGHINFQLLGLMRGVLQMGVGPATEKGRLSLFRSSMQVMAGITDANGNQLRENLTFTTFQALEGNSGRVNAATSGVVVNMTMAHTVRPNEARGCEICHSLVDTQGKVRNEHLMANTFGVGSGSMLFTGDWLIAGGLNGIELFDYKQEKELGVQNFSAGVSRFPGLIVNPVSRVLANVEPLLTGVTANDVLLLRNFTPPPATPGGAGAATFRDFTIAGLDNGTIAIADVSLRGHPAATAASGANGNLKTVTTTGANPVRSLTHMASDVSDPFVYAAIGAGGIDVLELSDAPPLTGGPIVVQGPFNTPIGGEVATEIAMSGDFVFVGTASGKILTFLINKDNPRQLIAKGQGNVGAAVLDIAIVGFVLYVATPQGLAILTLDDIENPARPAGAPQFVPNTSPATGVAVAEGHAYVATQQGIVEVDARTVAAPKAGVLLDANANQPVADVIVSEMPGQRWVLGLEAQTGNIVGVKLDRRLSRQERCFPDPGTADCLLEMDMYDTQRDGRDPSFNPNTNQFDAFDPSGAPFFRINRAILANGRRLARPVAWEAIGTLSGRRYRDSFMPGSGALSTQVMQAMRNVQVCETDKASTNPSGLNLLGIVEGGNCVAFPDTPIQKPACKPGLLGPGLRRVVCPPEPSRDLKTADPATPNKPAPPKKAATTVSAQRAIVPTRR